MLTWSLQSAQNANKIPSAKTLIILTHCILQFLAELNAKDLAHCDLKFSNILLARDQDPHFLIPKVCDFGLSTTISNLKYGKVVGGTPKYHPPEVINT
ncbi:MAG: hypothetical protein EZS28_051324 [Streblomastix strix]|uniref:Protein kinase domain-containing protein n=1 Tax=Streblomastix strix TaxID=222440 RepID=A0A5J4T3X8_9EUKA|nr:MAG: hypothetical protein EZS28_051324 [Streblomastix strix]